MWVLSHDSFYSQYAGDQVSFGLGALAGDPPLKVIDKDQKREGTKDLLSSYFAPGPVLSLCTYFSAKLYSTSALPHSRPSNFVLIPGLSRSCAHLPDQQAETWRSERFHAMSHHQWEAEPGWEPCSC